MKLTDENIRLIEKFQDAMRRSFFVDGKLVTRVHNEVFGRNLSPTNCVTCVKNRIKDLVNALNQFKESLKAQEEDKTIETIDQQKEVELEETPKKKVGRPRKVKE